jgi:hypothetical protein
MKIIHLIFFLTLITSSCSDTDFILKQIDQDGLRIKWYRQSYITSTNQFVSASLNGKEELIMRCNENGITNIYFEKKNIVIQIFQPSNLVIYYSRSNVFGFTVKIDSAVTYNDYLRVYQPQFYKKDEK